jgi:hypothetical protein
LGDNLHDEWGGYNENGPYGSFISHKQAKQYYQEIHNILHEAQVPYFILRGNHDR